MTEPLPDMLNAAPPEEEIQPAAPSKKSPFPPDIIRLGILLSGQGSNFKAIAQAIESQTLTNAKIAVVISNKVDAPGLLYAQDAGFPTVSISPDGYDTLEEYDTRILEQLQSARVDLTILAGYNKILSPVLLAAYPEAVLNIHPSLLPAYGGAGMIGIKVHQAVIAGQEAESGCTVHIVTHEVDQGPILGQTRVSVYPEDTPEQLAQRILEQEHMLYPQVIQEKVNQLLQSRSPESTMDGSELNILQEDLHEVLS